MDTEERDLIMYRSPDCPNIKNKKETMLKAGKQLNESTKPICHK